MTAKTRTSSTKVEQEAGEVFCEEDVAHAGRRQEIELDAAAVHAERVIGEDGDAEDGVGDGDGKDEVAEASAGAHAVGEEKDHEDRRDEAVELVDIAAEVDEFLLQAGDDGVVEAKDAGVAAGCEAGRRSGDGCGVMCRGSAGDGLVGLSGLAEVFSEEFAMHAPGVDAEEESAKEGEAKE